LFGGEWNWIVVIADVEIRNDAEDALLFFDLDLILRQFNTRGGDADFRDRSSENQRNIWDRVDLSRVQDSRGGLRGEAYRGNGDLEGPGRDADKGELSIVLGKDLLVRGLILT
jgi:hypothetical protein